MDWQKIFGANVRRLREGKRLRDGSRLTQEKLAFESKIDLTYMGGIERGKRNPSLLVIVRIAKALGVPPADLLKR
jgi:transcriptional regulator with XRE-family HTH domain